MKYTQQLYLVISLIVIRVLMLVLYTFFKSPESSPYTPYILLLYFLIDVVILYYLYHFVRIVKQQPFSLIAVIVVLSTIGYNMAVSVFSLFDKSEWTQMEAQLAEGIPNLINLIAKIILIVQLIRNKAEDRSQRNLKLLGWSYVFVMLVGLGSVFFEDAEIPFHFIQVIAALPWVAMILLYVYEIKQGSPKKFKTPL